MANTTAADLSSDANGGSDVDAAPLTKNAIGSGVGGEHAQGELTHFNELALTALLDQGSNYMTWTTNVEAKATYIVWNDDGYYREVKRDYATENTSGWYGDRDEGETYYYKIVLEDRQGNVLETGTYTQVWGGKRILEYELNPQVIEEGDTFSVKIDEGENVTLTFEGMTDFMSYDDDHFLNIAPGEGDVGEYPLTVIAVDSDGYRNTKVVRILVTDKTTAPVVTNLEMVGEYGDSANVRWATKEPTTVYLEYGTDTGYGTVIDMTDEPGTMHYAKLEDLGENTTYHYRIVCRDKDDNVYVSPDQVLQTTEHEVIDLFEDAEGDTVHLDLPYSLDREGAVYVLQKDVVASRSAFQILHDNITLDLNGHTVVYGDGPACEIANWSFEEGESGWDFSGAPAAEVLKGVYSADAGGGEVYTGDHSLAFTLSEGMGEQYVLGDQVIEIQAGYSYNLSAMMYGHLDSYTDEGAWYSPDIQMVVQFVDADTLEPLVNNIEAMDDGICVDLGYYYKQANFRADEDMRVRIRIGIRGAGLNDPNVFKTHPERTVRVDDIVLATAYSYGVIKPSHYNRKEEPDTATCSLEHGGGTVIKNGTFLQSERAKAFGSDTFRNLIDAEIADVFSVVYGTDSHNVSSSETGGLHIHDSTFVDCSTNLSSRHQQTGGNVKIGWGLNLIENNRIIGGSQYGINIRNGGLIETAGEIAHNHLSNNTKCTQGYNIGAYGDNLYIHHNDIISENGNGIHVSGENNRVYANYLNLSRTPTQEYGWRDRHFGIELRAAAYCEVYGNEVIVRNNGDRDYSAALSVRQCIRGLKIHDNIFTAIGSVPQEGVRPYTSIRASAVRFYSDDAPDTRFYNNTLRSNDSAISYESAVYGGIFIDNTFERLEEGTVIASVSNEGRHISNPVTPTDQPFQVLKYFWCSESQTQRDAGYFYSTELANIDEVLDNTYQWSRAWEGVAFDMTISSPQAHVTVFDWENNILFDGVSDGNGFLGMPLTFTERYINDDRIAEERELGPYRVFVSQDGYHSVMLVVNRATARHIEVNLIPSGEDPPVVAADLNGDGTVGSADIALIRLHWDEYVLPGDWTMGDLNGDGQVCSTDLDIIRENWGLTAPAAAEEDEPDGNRSDLRQLEEPVLYGPAKEGHHTAAADAVFAGYRTFSKALWIEAVEALRARRR